MNTRYFYTLILCLFASIGLQAQTLSDALRLTQVERQGSARFLGSGSSMGALGADFGAIGSNPAGLANFRKSEFILSLGTQWTEANTALQNGELGSYSTNENSVSIPGFAMVFTKQPIGSEWKQVNFGIGFHRLADFNREFFFEDRSSGSITQRFVELGNGMEPNQLDFFEAGLAYEAYVTYYDTIQNKYGADVFEEDVLLKRQEIYTSGSVNELNISFGGNYNDRLLIGASIGVPFFSYIEEKFYNEFNENLGIFKELDYNTYVDARGVGFNFALGAIFKPTRFIHVSAAVQSPTWYRINENFDADMRYDYEYIEQLFPEPGPKEALSPFGEFDYNISTPWRFNTGFGAIVGRSGFISAEVEYVDYAAASFNLARNQSVQDFEREERDLNLEVEDQLDDAINVRVGGELALECLRLRGGLGFEQQPFINDNNFIESYSGGIGYRGNRFYLDIGYRYRNDQYNYALYVLEDAEATPIVQSDLKNHRVSVTFGFKL